MNAAELMVKCLENEGVKYIFGVPGEENEAFMFALQDSSITFVPVRHEQGGAFMADLWGRLTGDAGVCLATLGPGATNLMTAVADAQLDKAPIVTITGQGGSDRLHHESHQVIDVVSMMSSITKWNSTVNSPEIIPEIVRKAFKIAQNEKPGATHIELPEDIAFEKADSNTLPLTKSIARRPMPDHKALNDAIAIITKAKKPIIIAGNGAIRTRASQAIHNLATNCNIPIASTFMGKGAISDKQKQSLGTIGLGFKDYVIEAIEQSDVVITIGYDIAEYDPINWNKQKDKTIIHMDFEIAEVYTHYNPKLEIIGDIAAGINFLNEQLSENKFGDWYMPVRDRISKSIDNYTASNDSTKFNAPNVISAVREVMPDDGLLISDVGSHKMWIARNYRTYCPNGCIISNGLATMGIALPGAIAAKLVDNKRAVISIMGDGGALMNIQELETAKRLGTGCIFIILNDNNYGLIKWKQEMSEGKSFGTDLGNPNFVALANSFGIDGYKPSTIGELKQTLTESIKHNKLALIEVPITTEVNQELISELENYYK